MSYRVSFTRSSKRRHDKLDTAIKNRIDKSFRQLVDYYDAKGSKKPDVKSLSGKYNGLLRLRVDDYRVIFQVRGDEFVILVVQIVKRGDAYR
ncbi:type II toxin-antitoxin system RelE/ParE family toxin [Mesotoga sp. B105.6.4]|uniref:type II toxin-antitoxin system RelE family toxin n=1 Tax=Mesotoga sp. B105.6.4 TaxID=1582224 RepID=UPI000CCF8C60|nr:type II toxin-antitoxin system RelE/ParE family toxin [Mesotoga sp. B105.6.4]PNS42174.1 addiction module toxin RelE [Mesotoga sp. B105.6.4]RAM59233.1 addiction module toxin RelE [Mesotoga sp. SC_4PWA21]